MFNNASGGSHTLGFVDCSDTHPPYFCWQMWHHKSFTTLTFENHWLKRMSVWNCRLQPHFYLLSENQKELDFLRYLKYLKNKVSLALGLLSGSLLKQECFFFVLYRIQMLIRGPPPRIWRGSGTCCSCP